MIEKEEENNRELSSTIRSLKFLIDSVKELSTSSEYAKEEVNELAKIMVSAKGEERRLEIDRYRANRERIELEVQLQTLLRGSNISEKERLNLLQSIDNESKAGAKSFKEYIERMKEANLNLKEMGAQTVQFFNLTRAGIAAAVLNASSSVFDAAQMSKKAALVVGGPRMTAGMFTPDPNISNQMPGFFRSMANMGNNLDQSVDSLRRWNLTVREQGSESGSSSNAKIILGASLASTAMAKLAQVSESTANKLTETLMMKLNYSGEQVQGMFQKLINSNKMGALTNEQYISSVTEMIEKNAHYNTNMAYAIPIVKQFDSAIRNGTFTMAEIASTFTAMANMPAQQSSGLAMLIKQSGAELPKEFNRAGNNPLAMAEASFFAGNDPKMMMGALKVFSDMAKQQGFGEGAPGRLTSMSISAKHFGMDLDPRQIQSLLEALKNQDLTKERLGEITKPTSDIEKLAGQVTIQTNKFGELLIWTKNITAAGSIKITTAAEQALKRTSFGEGIAENIVGKAWNSFRGIESDEVLRNKYRKSDTELRDSLKGKGNINSPAANQYIIPPAVTNHFYLDGKEFKPLIKTVVEELDGEVKGRGAGDN